MTTPKYSAFGYKRVQRVGVNSLSCNWVIFKIKGSGIIVLDFDVYLKACIEHVEGKTTTGDSYYKKVDKGVLTEAKEKILKIVKESYDNEIVSKEQYLAMSPGDNEIPGRLYATFKVPKKYDHGKSPPLRPIVSCSGT